MPEKRHEQVRLTPVYDKVPNKFELSVAVAKRARQLKEGSRPLVEWDETVPVIPVIAALQEIADDRIKVTMLDEVDSDQVEIDEMDQLLEKEVLAEADDEDGGKKKSSKDKDKDKDSKKSRSKSLAA